MDYHFLGFLNNVVPIEKRVGKAMCAICRVLSLSSNSIDLNKTIDIEIACCFSFLIYSCKYTNLVVLSVISDI